MAKPCHREGCASAGIYYPVLLVPPLGGTMQQAMQMAIGLELCRHHMGEVKAADLLLPESRQRIRIALMARGWAMPDFARVAIYVGSVGDRRWLDFQKLGARS